MNGGPISISGESGIPAFGGVGEPAKKPPLAELKEKIAEIAPKVLATPGQEGAIGPLEERHITEVKKEGGREEVAEDHVEPQQADQLLEALQSPPRTAVGREVATQTDESITSMEDFLSSMEGDFEGVSPVEKRTTEERTSPPPSVREAATQTVASGENMSDMEAFLEGSTVALSPGVPEERTLGASSLPASVLPSASPGTASLANHLAHIRRGIGGMTDPQNRVELAKSSEEYIDKYFEKKVRAVRNIASARVRGTEMQEDHEVAKVTRDGEKLLKIAFKGAPTVPEKKTILGNLGLSKEEERFCLNCLERKEEGHPLPDDILLFDEKEDAQLEKEIEEALEKYVQEMEKLIEKFKQLEAKEKEQQKEEAFAGVQQPLLEEKSSPEQEWMKKFVDLGTARTIERNRKREEKFLQEARDEKERQLREEKKADQKKHEEQLKRIEREELKREQRLSEEKKHAIDTQAMRLSEHHTFKQL